MPSSSNDGDTATTAPEPSVSRTKRPRDMDLDSGQAASLTDGGDTDMTVPDHSVKRTKDNSYEEEVSYPLNVDDTRGISCDVRLHLGTHCRYPMPWRSIPLFRLAGAKRPLELQTEVARKRCLENECHRLPGHGIPLH